MKKFLIRLIVIIFITLFVDRALALVVKVFYKTATTTDEFKLNFVTYKMHEPIIFMGSSRSHHHYIPSIIEDTLKTKVYNAGLWGMRNVYFQYGLLCNILQRYTPKTIFLEIHPIDFLKTPYSDLTSVSNLSPFVNYSKGCDNVLKEANYYYKDELSYLYRYNSLFPNLILGNVFQRTDPNDKGFKPLFGTLDLSNGPIKPEQFNFKTDPNKVKYFQEFIDKCKAKNIQLVLLFSPMYAVDSKNFMAVPDSLAKKNHIIFLNNYNMKGITGHAEYYHDFGHLNEAGAKEYSSMIAHELKKYIN